MVAEKVSHCPGEERSNLIARAVSIACLRIANPGPSFVCLDLILQLLAAELWGNSPKRPAAASHDHARGVQHLDKREAAS
jgi:hypothetical protein